MPDTVNQLRRELDETRARLAEMEEALDAIRSGEVDGLVTTGADGQTQIFTMSGAQEPYRLLIEQMSEGALTLSREGVILYANERLAQLLATPLEQVIGAELRSFVAAADQPVLSRLLDGVARGSRRGEMTLLTAGGTAIPVWLGMSQLQVGAELFTAVVVSDRTAERQLVEELEHRVRERTAEIDAARLAALNLVEDAVLARDKLAAANEELRVEMAARQASEARYRFLCKNMLEGFAHCQMLYENGRPHDFVYLDVNHAFEKISGLTNVIGKKVSEVIPGIQQTNPQLFEVYGRVATTGQPERLEAYVELLGVWFQLAVYSPKQEQFIAVFDDITERKRIEMELRTSEARLRRYFESPLIGITITSPAKNWIEVNDRLCEMLGYSREELMRLTWLELTEPADRAADVVQFERVLAGEIESYQMEKRFMRKDGRSVFTELSVACVRTESGAVDYIVALVQDISQRKMAEAALAQTSRELLSKNTELERFLYTASHDLKSPVVTTRTFLEYLERDLVAGETETVKKDMGFIRAATDKMVLLLDELLEMSRIGHATHVPVNLTFKTVVADALAAVAGRIAARGVMVQVAECTMALVGDRGRLGEIWQNLLDNACKFMGRQTAPRIEVGVEERAGETVFFVRDNGIGIDPRYQGKVFELFEKLDAKSEGTGIGLALVKRIVELYGGRIWLESAGLGQGTCFYFTLPAAVNQPKAGARS